MEKENIGVFIAQLRKEQQLTQKAVAECLHVSDKAVSKWERGLNYPDITLLEPLAELLHVSVTELIAAKRMNNEVEKEDADQVLKETICIGNVQFRDKRRQILIAMVLICLGILLLSATASIKVMSHQKRSYEAQAKKVPTTEMSIEDLLVYENAYVGNHVNMIALYEHLPLYEVAKKYEIEEVPSGFVVYYEMTAWYVNQMHNDETYLHKTCLFNAMATFTLIHNVDKITYHFTDTTYTIAKSDILEKYPDLGTLKKRAVWQKEVVEQWKDNLTFIKQK